MRSARNLCCGCSRPCCCSDDWPAAGKRRLDQFRLTRAYRPQPMTSTCQSLPHERQQQGDHGIDRQRGRRRDTKDLSEDVSPPLHRFHAAVRSASGMQSGLVVCAERKRGGDTKFVTTVPLDGFGPDLAAAGGSQGPCRRRLTSKFPASSHMVPRMKRNWERHPFSLCQGQRRPVGIEITAPPAASIGLLRRRDEGYDHLLNSTFQPSV